MKTCTSLDERNETIFVKDWMQTEPKRCNHILGKVSHAIVEITGFVSLLHRLDAYSGMHMVFPLHRCLGCEGWSDQSVVWDHQSVVVIETNWKGMF